MLITPVPGVGTCLIRAGVNKNPLVALSGLVMCEVRGGALGDASRVLLIAHRNRTAWALNTSARL